MLFAYYGWSRPSNRVVTSSCGNQCTRSDHVMRAHIPCMLCVALQQASNPRTNLTPRIFMRIRESDQLSGEELHTPGYSFTWAPARIPAHALNVGPWTSAYIRVREAQAASAHASPTRPLKRFQNCTIVPALASCSKHG
jgi:hypothetical protein